MFIAFSTLLVYFQTDGVVCLEKRTRLVLVV